MTPRPSSRRAAASVAPRDQAALVYRAIRDLIVDGQIAPGSRLVESEIATRFQVSRTPVRTALDRLEQEGLAVTPPGLKHSLAQVAPLTQADAVELMEAVAALEGVAARRAAALSAAARKRLAAALRRVNARLRAEAGKPDAPPRRLLQLDAEFHELLIKAGGGRRIAGLLDVIRPQATRYSQLYVLLLAGKTETSLAEHEAIIRAIERGHPEQAQRAAEANLRNAASRLAQAIQAMGEQGGGRG